MGSGVDSRGDHCKIKAMTQAPPCRIARMYMDLQGGLMYLTKVWFYHVDVKLGFRKQDGGLLL